MTAARARAPKAPVRTIDAADDAALVAVLHQAQTSLAKLGRVSDGSRSEVMAVWAREIARVAQPMEDAELAAAAAVAELVAS